MADKYYWLGSIGPLIYDPTETVADPSLVYDGIAAPNQAPVVTDGTITVGTIELTDLTASRLVQTDVAKELASVTDLTSWLAGIGGVTVTNDGDGTATVTGRGFGAAVAKTISGGAISLSAGERQIQLTGEGNAADDLTSITGGVDGDEIVLRGKDALGYTITVKDAGTLHLQADFGIDSMYDTITLMNIGSNEWIELSRANNA